LGVYASKVDQEKLFQELTGFNIVDFSKGAIGGIILYLFFYIGYSSMRTFLLGGASKVYLFRAESPTTIIAVSLIITSFCEEFFWRAYIQRNLVLHYGLKNGILITTIAYALIHAPTMNTPLIFAALIAGLFWGILYAQTQNIWLVTASHLFWTELIFVFLPLK
jgi:membrane protease YdiL (CAAX protease family)